MTEPEDGTSVERDFNAEMNEKIVETFAEIDGDFVSSIVAWDLVTKLMETDPELLSGWLHLHAKSFVAGVLNSHVRSFRAKARSQAKASAFATAARRFEATGDISDLGGWFNVRYVVDDQSTQRRLGEMSQADLLFVASRYGRTARTLLLEEAFHRALAARVGNRTVADVFTEDQISEMYRGLSSGTSTVAS
jgi:hypothetical protein